VENLTIKDIKRINKQLKRHKTVHAVALPLAGNKSARLAHGRPETLVLEKNEEEEEGGGGGEMKKDWKKREQDEKLLFPNMTRASILLFYLFIYLFIYFFWGEPHRVVFGTTCGICSRSEWRTILSGGCSPLTLCWLSSSSCWRSKV
jgi:hypothetical protein